MSQALALVERRIHRRAVEFPFEFGARAKRAPPRPIPGRRACASEGRATAPARRRGGLADRTLALASNVAVAANESDWAAWPTKATSGQRRRSIGRSRATVHHGDDGERSWSNFLYILLINSSRRCRVRTFREAARRNSRRYVRACVCCPIVAWCSDGGYLAAVCEAFRARTECRACPVRASRRARGRQEAVVARAADDRCARTTYRDDSYVRGEKERGRERERVGYGTGRGREKESEGENARASPRKRRSAVDESSRARTTGLSCAFLGVTDVVAVRLSVRGLYRRHRARGGVVRESGPPVGPGPRQRSLAKACGAIPREHAEPGHEEVRASEMEIGRERASERVARA